MPIGSRNEEKIKLENLTDPGLPGKIAIGMVWVCLCTSVQVFCHCANGTAVRIRKYCCEELFNCCLLFL